MPSAAFSINAGASLAKASVAAGGAIAVALDSTDGVDTTLWEVTLTDDTTVPGSYAFAAPTATSTSTTALTAGTAGIIRCTVNNGVGDNAIKTAKFYVPTVGEREVLVTGEVYESDATHGWGPAFNSVVRSMDLTLSTVATSLVTAAYDAVQLCDPGGGGFTVDLPTAVSMNGRVVMVVNVGASTNTITVDGNAAETINGATTDTIVTAYGAQTYLAYGGGWVKL